MRCDLLIFVLAVLQAPVWVGCVSRQDRVQGLMPMNTVAPLPVPQPIYPREQLSDELQILWSRIEEAVDVRPPSPPTVQDTRTIENWAKDSFKQWLIERQILIQRALEATFALRHHPAYERGIGAALFAYMYEELASSIRGAPVPNEIAADPALLQIYTDALDGHLVPYAELAVRAYDSCLLIFDKFRDPAWGEWVEYCAERGREVAEIFNIQFLEPNLSAEVSF